MSEAAHERGVIWVGKLKSQYPYEYPYHGYPLHAEILVVLDIHMDIFDTKDIPDTKDI